MKSALKCFGGFALLMAFSGCGGDDVDNGLPCPPEGKSGTCTAVFESCFRNSDSSKCDYDTKNAEKSLKKGYCPDSLDFVRENNGSFECIKSGTAHCCGDNCIDCTAGEGVQSASCQTDGTCKITSCEDGYALSSNNSCVPVDDHKCGEMEIDCTQGEGVASGKCLADGTCKYTCTAEYKFNSKGNKCIPKKCFWGEARCLTENILLVCDDNEQFSEVPCEFICIEGNGGDEQDACLRFM